MLTDLNDSARRFSIGPTAGKRVSGAKPPAVSANLPAFEHIVTNANETFLWRADDYPWERNAWNYHPEIEIHLSGIAVLFR